MVNKNTKIAKKPSDKQKKKAVANYVLFLEYLSLALTVGLIFYLIYISNSIQDCVQAINSTADPFNPQDPLFIILGIVASFGVKALIKIILGGFYRRNLVEKASNRETTEQRLVKLYEYSLHFIFASTLSIAFFVLIRETELNPKLLGGTLDNLNNRQAWPNCVSETLRRLFLFRLGKQIQETYYQIRHNRGQKDFYIMNFHHFVTVFLMAVSYLNRELQWGIPIIYLHDRVDPFLYLTRLFKEIKPLEKLTMPVFLITYFLWFYDRILIFTKEVLFELVPYYNNIYDSRPYHKETVLFQVICLFSLAVLNYYWFSMISLIIYNALVTDKLEALNEGEGTEELDEDKKNK